MQRSLSSFYVTHSVLQCLVCCQHIIHRHCDLNSSLLSRIPPPKGISLEVRKLLWEAGHRMRFAWHELKISFGEKTNKQNAFVSCCFHSLNRIPDISLEELLMNRQHSGCWRCPLLLVAFWWHMFHHLCLFIILLQVRVLLWLSYCCCRDKSCIFWLWGRDVTKVYGGTACADQA